MTDMMMAGDDLGFIKRFAKKVGSVAKKVGKGVVALHTLPAKLALKAALTAVNVVCRAPGPVLHAAALSSGVPKGNIDLFCKASRVRDMAGVRRLLPSAFKVTATLAATGAFPAAGPALAVLKKIPGLGLGDPRRLDAQIGALFAGFSDAEISDALSRSPDAQIGQTDAQFGAGGTAKGVAAVVGSVAAIGVIAYVVSKAARA